MRHWKHPQFEFSAIAQTKFCSRIHGTWRFLCLLAIVSIPVAGGCGRTADSDKVNAVPGLTSGATTNSAESSQTAAADSTTGGGKNSGSEKSSVESSGSQADQQADDDDNISFAPLTLNSGTQSATAPQSGDASVSDRELAVKQTIEHLQPLQIMLGQWRGTTRREFDGFKAVDAHEWVWDLRTNPAQPALVVKSDKSPWLRSARLTWDSTLQQYQMTATDGDGVTRQFQGTFTDPVHEVTGSDDKLHRVYRLEFRQLASESPAADGGNAPEWQIAFDQQENNRYLLEISQRRGTGDFRRFDTVSTQRSGTSFAISDSDYAEKTCVISEGLGTMELTYKGRSYWVCCSGCRAAFEDDPETWIARAAKRQNEKKASGSN